MQGREEGFGNVICVADEENENLSWGKKGETGRERRQGEQAAEHPSRKERGLWSCFQGYRAKPGSVQRQSKRGRGGTKESEREREKGGGEQIKGRGICSMNERKKETACGGNASESARITE